MPKTEINIPEYNWHWIDVVYPTPEELQELADKYNLHPSSVKDCLQPEHLPKYEVINNIVFIITRIYDLEAHSDADTIQELTSKIAIFFSENFLITIHRRPLPLIPSLQQDYIDTGRVKTSFEFLLKVIRGSFKTYETPSQKLTNDLDFYETKIFLQTKVPPLTKGLYHLKRKAAVSKKVLQLSESILECLRHYGNNSPEVQDLVDYHLRISTIYDEINDSTNNLLNMYISLSGQRTNEVMRVLTIFSVFFMPLTFIAGIYGMNFSFMPELKEKYGYPMTMLAMVTVATGIYFGLEKISSCNWFFRFG